MLRPKVCLPQVYSEEATTYCSVSRSTVSHSDQSSLTPGIRCSCQYGLPGRIEATHENRNTDTNSETWKAEDNDVETHPTNRAGMLGDITEAYGYLSARGWFCGRLESRCRRWCEQSEGESLVAS